jgi:hypothetical protein
MGWGRRGEVTSNGEEIFQMNDEGLLGIEPGTMEFDEAPLDMLTN